MKKHSKILRSLLAIVIAILMVGSVIPTVALAADEEVSSPIGEVADAFNSFIQSIKDFIQRIIDFFRDLFGCKDDTDKPSDEPTTEPEPEPEIEPIYVTPDNFLEVDFTQADQVFSISGDFGDANIEITELGEGSALTFADVTSKEVIFRVSVVLTGESKINGAVKSVGNGEEPIELAIKNGTVDLGSNYSINVENKDNLSILTVEDSTLKCNSLFVGGHTQNNPNDSAEFNVTNSYISCEENVCSSTIAIWGKNGVNANIVDSEIHTYSRGWHQSEDANDNAITFQGGNEINVNIERSNMHLYGARSIINARKYYDDACKVNFTIDESLIWVVTKSSHADETIPVWGDPVITNSVLLFTKNVYHESNPAVVKSFVYGNPVINGNYAVTTQCGWDTEINVADGQTVTIAKDANVSVYEGASPVNFVLSGSAKVVVEAGAALTNIGVKAAEGYTLKTATSNGVTTYTVS